MANQDNKKLSDRDLNYQRAFATDPGKIVLEDLKAMLRHGKTIYQPKQTERDNAFEQGRQSVINDIIFILSKEGK